MRATTTSHTSMEEWKYLYQRTRRGHAHIITGLSLVKVWVRTEEVIKLS